MYRASVSFHSLFDDEESQTCLGRVTEGEAFFEYSILDIIGNAAAVIGDSYFACVAFLFYCYGDMFCLSVNDGVGDDVFYYRPECLICKNQPFPLIVISIDL